MYRYAASSSKLELAHASSIEILHVHQDASGWTPLMIASSLREEDGLVDLLLGKEADVDVKTYSGQVRSISY